MRSAWLWLVLIIGPLTLGPIMAAGRSEIIDFYTGNQLVAFCQQVRENCIGYILGVAAARSGNSFCFPRGVIGEQVVGTVTLWLNNHPEKTSLARK
jgi:hypothetical protein